MKNFSQWEGFKGNRWKEKIDVRNFISMNYTPYDGDASFLEEPTEATNKLWGKLQELQNTSGQKFRGKAAPKADDADEITVSAEPPVKQTRAAARAKLDIAVEDDED